MNIFNDAMYKLEYLQSLVDLSWFNFCELTLIYFFSIKMPPQ